MTAMCTVMPETVEDAVMFKGDEDTFESLFGKLVSFASVKHSLRLEGTPARVKTQRVPHAMAVDEERSRSGRGKRVTCWVGNSTGHIRARAKEGQAKRRKMARCSVTTVEATNFACCCTSNRGHKSGEKGNGKDRQEQEQEHAIDKSMQSFESETWSVKPWKEDVQWETAVGRLRQTVHGLRCVERSTSILCLGTRRNHPIMCNTRTRSGSSSITTWEQLRQAYLWNLLKVFRCTKWVSSSLRMVRIPNFGRANFQTVDEFGNKRKMEGLVTEVHRPLASASEISTYHDAFIVEKLGALIPRHTRVVEGLECHRLCQLHGFDGILPLYREERLYNYYLRRAEKLELAPVGEQSEGLEIVLANDDTILGWIPTFSGDVISRCRRCGRQDPLGTRDGSQMVSSEPRVWRACVCS